MWSSVLTLVSLLPALCLRASPTPINSPVTLEQREISSAVYDSLVFYFQYASSAYSPGNVCPQPNGNTYFAEINDVFTDTQGFIARDDKKKEIVISLRGSSSLKDFLIDANIVLVPMESPGVSNPPDGVRVHGGFLKAWNSVAESVISIVRDQLSSYPGYSIATTGHSLGGSLSSLAAVSMKANFANVPVRMFSYGQPRTGNALYAGWVNDLLGPENNFRATHTTDQVPHLPPQEIGYSHHGVEYWTMNDPASPASTRKCAVTGEDPSCSNSAPLTVSLAHLYYFNIMSGTPFCF